VQQLRQPGAMCDQLRPSVMSRSLASILTPTERDMPTQCKVIGTLGPQVRVHAFGFAANVSGARLRTTLLPGPRRRLYRRACARARAQHSPRLRRMPLQRRRP
jgi:hypothetical protein